MFITIVILLVIILIFLLIIIFYFLNKKPKETSEINIDNLKETIHRIEEDLKNNFGVLSQDQKTIIEKWAVALQKLDINDISIKSLKTELENLATLSDSKQASSIEKITKLTSKLDENLNNINILKTNVQDLNNIFYNSRSRGTLGEFSLNSILVNILGENSKIWEKQYTLVVDGNRSEKGKVDALIRTGDGSENIAIDAKFPLDKYDEMQKIINNKESDSSYKISEKAFKIAVKNKIMEVKKYINHKNKITNAILFVPSEAVFYYLISSDMKDIFENSFKDKVWICSPTTLSAVLHMLFQVQKDYELNKNIIKVKELIVRINNEYKKFDERWKAVKKKILDNQKELKELDITIEKINKNQEKLEAFDLKENAIE